MIICRRDAKNAKMSRGFYPPEFFFAPLASLRQAILYVFGKNWMAMIPGTSVFRQVPAWQAELVRAITEHAELLAAWGLGPEWLPAARGAARRFPLRVAAGGAG